ncbi:hypothetical protein FBU30_010678 [Linnemannia zychae]|nr:hypothetical protein FBU30_010678 [Linnemannia zychae]
MEYDSFLTAHNKEYLANAQAQEQAQAQSPPTKSGLQQSNDPYLISDSTATYSTANSSPHHRQSPTLSTAHYTRGSDNGYTPPKLQYSQAYQPYQSTSPRMDAMSYRASQQQSGSMPSAYSSNNTHSEDRMDYRQDPYRSAYGQQHHQMQHQQHLGAFSPYQGMSYEDMNQGTHHSRLSLASSSVSGVSQQRYPMHVLQSHGSTQALSTSFHQNSHHGGSTGPGSSVSEYGGRSDQENEEHSTTRSRIALAVIKQQPDKEEFAIGERAKSEDDDLDENTEILARNSHSRDRSAISLSSQKRANKSDKKKSKKGSRGGGLSEESDEEEAQERGENRYRDKKRCFCCSRRVCVYMTFLMIVVLGVTLYFLVPRAPAFSFLSVSSMGPPTITTNEFHESFGLQLRVDSSENYLPLKINSIEMTVWMKIDQTKIGHNEGLPSSYVIKPKVIQVINIPMVFDYTSYMIDTNADGTFQRLIEACRTVNPKDLSLTIGGKINVWGLSWIWKPQFGLNVGNIDCPVNAKDPSAITSLPPPPPPVTQSPPSASATAAMPSAAIGATDTPRPGGSQTAPAPAPAGSRT